jgi:hypothetical protein
MDEITNRLVLTYFRFGDEFEEIKLFSGVPAEIGFWLRKQVEANLILCPMLFNIPPICFRLTDHDVNVRYVSAKIVGS